MLKVWVNIPEQRDLVLNDVEALFPRYADYKVIETELGQRIVKATSCVVEVSNYVTLWLDTGMLISPDKLSDGAKVLLLMLSEKARKKGFIFNYTFCGENCDEFLEEIADMYDVNLFLGRFYIPFERGLPKSGVKFMESGRIVYNDDDFIDEYYKLDMSQLETIEDDTADGISFEEFLRDAYSDD